MIVVYKMTGNNDLNKDKDRPVWKDDKDALVKFCHNSMIQALNPTKVYYVLDTPTQFMIELIGQSSVTQYPACLIHSGWVTKLEAAGAAHFEAIKIAEGLPADEKYGIIEDDYFFTPNAGEVISNGLDKYDVVTPYVHPSFYKDLTNNNKTWKHRVEEIDGLLWQTVPSTTLTFCATGEFIHQEAERFKYWGAHDSELWEDINKRHQLWGPVPSVATHMEMKHLAAGVDWKSMFNL